MKIIVLIPVWQRPKIFDLVYKRFNEIRSWSKSEIRIFTAGSLSDPCYKVYKNNKHKGDKYFHQENKPVSNKMNRLFYEVRKIDFEYATIVGSDDVITDKAWSIFENALNEYIYHLVGSIDCSIYNTKTRECGYFNTRLLGKERLLGGFRFLHRRLLKALEYKPYKDGYDIRIDWTMEEKINKLYAVEVKKIEFGEGQNIDLKSETNINSFEKLRPKLKMFDYKLIPNEINYLIELYEGYRINTCI